jgi:hypothetical protein
VRRAGSSFPSILGTLTHTRLVLGTPWSLSRPRRRRCCRRRPSSSRRQYIYSRFACARERRSAPLNARASERGGERQKGTRREDNRVARTMRSGRGHDGVMSASVGLARAGVVGRGDIRRATRGKGRHKGVDKVAIAHGTQLHAPALPPANPLPSPGSHPRSTTPSALSRPRVVQPSRVGRWGALFQRALSPLNPLSRTIPAALPPPRALLPSPGPRSPLGITKRTTPLDSKREISQTTRWQRCSCRELLALDASTNLRGNPPVRPHARPEDSSAPSATSPLPFNPSLFVLCCSSSFLPYARSPHRRQPTARLNRTVPRRFRWVH